MDETIKIWLKRLYKKEIAEIEGTIENERLWELGYNGKAPNPHTYNIVVLNEYIEILKERINELNQL